MRRLIVCFVALFCLLWLPGISRAGNQQYEPLSVSVQAALSGSIADKKPPRSSFKDYGEAVAWLSAMSQRLAKRIPDQKYRLELLRAIHYEATRAGLDPQLVLGLIQVESGFRKYAVSSAGAKGYMQVMPFWVGLIGQPEDNLFHLRTNLRYGCTILRHYLDIEKGNLFRALGRYNGSLGRAEYPNLVRNAWNQWRFEHKITASETLPTRPVPAAPPKPAPLPAPVGQSGR
ncbi:MAG: lytic transglycosylase domain-containing protein [Zoogloeaceae bacterium]|jgi:soluble lytic murein transglycosylase-like protein|nr:lytic transglycosylase domain-containing protein [Zoogloeaceae bacterium]